MRSDVGKPRNWPNRFWKYVSVLSNDECWEWTGTLHYKGYGLISYVDKTLKAHRVSLELHSGGKIPDGHVVMHLCDNPKCVNPHHLMVGTSRDNVLDMFNKGRGNRPSGERHHKSKLTDEIVRAIRIDARPQRAIALEFGVSQPLIGMVKRRVIWGHVTD